MAFQSSGSKPVFLREPLVKLRFYMNKNCVVCPLPIAPPPPTIITCDNNLIFTIEMSRKSREIILIITKYIVLWHDFIELIEPVFYYIVYSLPI